MGKEPLRPRYTAQLGKIAEYPAHYLHLIE